MPDQEIHTSNVFVALNKKTKEGGVEDTKDENHVGNEGSDMKEQVVLDKVDQHTSTKEWVKHVFVYKIQSQEGEGDGTSTLVEDQS